MVAICCPLQASQCQKALKCNTIVSSSMTPFKSNNIKVTVNGATKEIGMDAIIAVTKVRGMELAAAVDNVMVGEDAVKSKANGVVVDFTEPSAVYENVKQAVAFGLRSVVYVPGISLNTIAALSAFCEKASMGCFIAPTLSIGSVLLQKAAITAFFHYDNMEIVESRPHATDLPSRDAQQIGNNLSNLGRLYNKDDLSTNNLARGQLLGEVLPGLLSSTTVHFSGPGENLVYGLEKFL